ncbi:hypothetical protein GCM10022223_33320 [Kineosporia mesophila]|uniref:Uncharacterized protein n=1 Tax=Kineosporia mesophila TaxID=566012 RepID=A0ABP6ZME0_9ACTN|nr:hypothetical protein [Kineosporia mesophila]MCD5353680.1 hypothetical protein [Kineosporia mesophila]
MITTLARRLDAGLLTMAVFLAATYFLASSLPGPAQSFQPAFVIYWNSGGPDFTPGLQALVDHQYRYHLARVVITLVLLAVLLTLSARLPRFRILLGALALVAAVLLIANVQGVVSPFGTLLPHLGSPSTDPRLPATLEQIRDQLADGLASPALDIMLDQYKRWHVVKAALISVLTAVLLGLSVLVWPRNRVLSLLTAILAACALVVVAANVTTVASPDAPFLELLPDN